MALSTKHSTDRRTVIESPWYQNRWGGLFKMSSDQNVKTEFQNTARGHMVATSLRGSATGKGGNFLIIDDPHDALHAESEKERKNDIDAFDLKLSTRLDDKKNGVIIVIMQRLHQEDLTGHLKGKGYEHLVLPCEAPKKTTIIFPMTKRKLVRPVDDILHKEREGKRQLADIKKQLGSYGYAGQYQQSPSPRTGGIWKRKHFARWIQRPPDDWEWLQSWDCNVTEGGTSYCVGQVWARKDANKSLVDQVRGKWGFTELLQRFKNLTDKWPQAARKLVENKANGPAVQNSLKDKISGIILVDPLGGKEVRAIAVEPEIEAGNVSIPDDSLGFDWVADFLEEAAMFPKGANDDQVDAASQALQFFATVNPAYGGKDRKSRVQKQRSGYQRRY